MDIAESQNLCIMADAASDPAAPVAPVFPT
jgi:hypothetical protein